MLWFWTMASIASKTKTKRCQCNSPISSLHNSLRLLAPNSPLLCLRFPCGMGRFSLWPIKLTTQARYYIVCRLLPIGVSNSKGWIFTQTTLHHMFPRQTTTQSKPDVPLTLQKLSNSCQITMRRIMLKQLVHTANLESTSTMIFSIIHPPSHIYAV